MLPARFRFSCLLCLVLCCLWTGGAFAQTPPSGEDVFDYYRNGGYDFEDRNQLDSALIFYEKALAEARRTEDQYNLATILTDLAILHRKKANYITCKSYHEQALEVARKSGDEVMVGDNLHGIGYLHEQIGDYDKAVQYYLQSLAISQQRGENEHIIATLQNISKTYMQLNMKDLALHNIEQAQSLATEMRHDSVMANVLQDYGEILLHFGDNERALDKLTAALQTYEHIKYERFIASAMVYVGDVYTRLGKPERTLEFFRGALAHRKAMDPYVLADMYYKTGSLLARQNRTAEARQNYRQSLDIATANRFRDLQQKNAFCLYEIARQEGETEAALQYLQLSSSLKDTLFDTEKTKRIAEMQLKYDNEKQQRAIQALELRQHRFVLFGSIAVFVLVIGSLGYIMRLSTRNNRLLEQKSREIQHQNIQLTESNEVLRQYAYVAAHDLKEPLRTICSFINLLEIKYGRKLEDPQAVEYMKFISESAKKMNLLLTDLLSYSSIFSQKPGSDVVDLQNVLEEVCTTLKNRIESKNGTVEFDSTDFPRLVINRIHLVQIFQNLIGNALKFIPEDRQPLVQVTWKPEPQSGEIVFSVRDNGIGISEKHREKIFNLFFRAVESKDKYEGTGIGLSICKSLTEKYGGRIWFQSVEGQGTTFFFTFPDSMVVHEEAVAERRAA